MRIKFCALFFALVFGCAFLTSCNNDTPSKEDFEFCLVDPILEVGCGDIVIYKAKLKNKTNNTYTLSHGIPLITIYIYTVGEKPEDGVFSTLLETKMEGLKTHSKELTTQFTEPGEYMVRAYCSFAIGDKQFRYEIEDQKISVCE